MGHLLGSAAGVETFYGGLRGTRLLDYLTATGRLAFSGLAVRQQDRVCRLLGLKVVHLLGAGITGHSAAECKIRIHESGNARRTRHRNRLSQTLKGAITRNRT